MEWGARRGGVGGVHEVVALSELRQTALGRPLRVLEIGAGTGATTDHILERLREAVDGFEYTFSDLSPQLVARARTRFGDSPELRFEIFDLEAPPIQREACDVVIAANVVHATADVVTSLAHVARLLAPGGALLMLEGTEPPPWLDLIFGGTEG